MALPSSVKWHGLPAEVLLLCFSEQGDVLFQRFNAVKNPAFSFCPLCLPGLSKLLIQDALCIQDLHTLVKSDFPK